MQQLQKCCQIKISIICLHEFVGRILCSVMIKCELSENKKIDAFGIGGMLMKKFLAITAHVISGLGNDLLGWVVIISYELTGSEGKFQDDVFHWIIFACGLIHIAVSVLYSLLVWKKGTANGHALSGKILAVYDIIMTLVPYMYWFVVCVL